MGTDARGGGGDPRATAFAVLIAAALLLHVLWWHGPVVWSPWAAVAAAAAWLIARPASVGRLAFLLGAAAVAIVAELPGLGSHLLLVLATAVCVLVHLGVGLWRPPGGGAGAGGTRSLPTAGELWPRLAPLLRAEVVVLYAAAVLSKLNDAYLEAATSPAGPLAGKVVWFAPIALDGDWRATVAIWGSLLVEVSLPVLLLVPRTRRVGLALGFAFHGVLAASGTVPFTALMLALYVAFLPAGSVLGRRALRRRSSPGSTGETTVSYGSGSERPGGTALSRGAGGLAVAVPLVALWLVGALAGLDPGRADGSVLATATRLVVLGAVVAAIVRLVRRECTVDGEGQLDPGTDAAGARSTPHDRRGAPGVVAPRRGRSNGRPCGVFLAGTVALVLCAASPYLGWRAGDAFTMYSGLRTSPSGWNHVLLPPALRLRD